MFDLRFLFLNAGSTLHHCLFQPLLTGEHDAHSPVQEQADQPKQGGHRQRDRPTGLPPGRKDFESISSGRDAPNARRAARPRLEAVLARRQRRKNDLRLLRFPPVIVKAGQAVFEPHPAGHVIR